MLILLSAALFGFGLLLFGLGLTVWLIGLAIRIVIWVFQLVLLIVWAGIAFYSWMQRRVSLLEAMRTELIKLEVSTGQSAVHERSGRAPPPSLRGNIRTKHGSRRVPYLRLVD
jgi:hypothetical protein